MRVESAFGVRMLIRGPAVVHISRVPYFKWHPSAGIS